MKSDVGDSANQFDVVYKIINDFNYCGNGIFVVSPSAQGKGRRDYGDALYSNGAEREEGPCSCECAHPRKGTYTHVQRAWRRGFNFQRIPRSHGLYNGIPYYESQNFQLAPPGELA